MTPSDRIDAAVAALGAATTTRQRQARAAALSTIVREVADAGQAASGRAARLWAWIDRHPEAVGTKQEDRLLARLAECGEMWQAVKRGKEAMGA